MVVFEMVRHVVNTYTIIVLRYYCRDSRDGETSVSAANMFSKLNKVTKVLDVKEPRASLALVQ